jgi:hypothetical protein
MRRARRQNQGRFDFAKILVLHGWDAVEASPRCNALRPELLGAPLANARGQLAGLGIERGVHHKLK